MRGLGLGALGCVLEQSPSGESGYPADLQLALETAGTQLYENVL